MPILRSLCQSMCLSWPCLHRDIVMRGAAAQMAKLAEHRCISQIEDKQEQNRKRNSRRLLPHRVESKQALATPASSQAQEIRGTKQSLIMCGPAQGCPLGARQGPYSQPARPAKPPSPSPQVLSFVKQRSPASGLRNRNFGEQGPCAADAVGPQGC
jgi:hypothetical protein